MDKAIYFAGKYPGGAKKAWETHGWKVYETKMDLPKILCKQLSDEMTRVHREWKVNAVFSFDFSPALAEECHRLGMRYISWVWDSPHTPLWAKATRYDTNLIFIFDYVLYQKMLSRNFTNVWYMPLSPDLENFQNTICEDQERSREKYQSDIAFVGNIYNDDAHSLYDKIAYLPPYTKGYLDSLMEIQRRMWGVDLLEECISDTIWEELKQYVKWDLGDRYEDDVYEMMMKGVFGKKIAQLERMEVCSYLARHFDFSLYTGADTSFDPLIHNKGYVGYQTEMPLIFHYSKINMHITIRSITSGVPLRVMDVLACEGFLLTNFQPEIAEYFEDGKDLVIYQDFQDMYEKMSYYLEHEEERRRIAHAGFLKVEEMFHYNIQVGKIISVLEQIDLEKTAGLR